MLVHPFPGCSCAQGNLSTPILINISQKSVEPFTHPSSQQVTILDAFEGRLSISSDTQPLSITIFERFDFSCKTTFATAVVGSGFTEFGAESSLLLNPDPDPDQDFV
jgi:hypothetical protein